MGILPIVAINTIGAVCGGIGCQDAGYAIACHSCRCAHGESCHDSVCCVSVALVCGTSCHICHTARSGVVVGTACLVGHATDGKSCNCTAVGLYKAYSLHSKAVGRGGTAKASVCGILHQYLSVFIGGVI